MSNMILRANTRWAWRQSFGEPDLERLGVRLRGQRTVKSRLTPADPNLTQKAHLMSRVSSTPAIEPQKKSHHPQN